MTSKEAIKRIMTILNFASKEKFFEAKTDQGLTMKMESEDMEIGKTLYVATDEGMIPAPAGVYQMEDGAQVTVDEMGMVSKIKMGSEEEVSKETEDAKKEKKDEETVIKDDNMSESKEIPSHKQEGDIELVDGTILRLSMKVLEEGVRVKKVGYDGTLSAIHDGDFETKGGDVITITGGEVKAIHSKAEKGMEGGQFAAYPWDQCMQDQLDKGYDEETAKKICGKIKAENASESFVEAKTAEGAIVDSPTFDVGEAIDVVTDGEKSPAPDGEHQVMLKDSEGNEVKIRVMVKDGKIVERENVEEAPEAEDEMKAMADAFAQAMNRIESKLNEISGKYDVLESKFKKFSNEPAGTKIPKQLNQDNFSAPVNSKVEGWRRLRETMSHSN